MQSLRQILIYVVLIIILVMSCKIIFHLNSSGTIIISGIFIFIVLILSFKRILKISVEDYEDLTISKNINPNEDLNISIDSSNKDLNISGISTSGDLNISGSSSNLISQNVDSATDININNSVSENIESNSNVNVNNLVGENIDSNINNSDISLETVNNIKSDKNIVTENNIITTESKQPTTIGDVKDRIRTKNNEMIKHINTNNKTLDVEDNPINQQMMNLSNVDINNTKLREDINNDDNYTSQSEEYEKSINKEKNISYKSNDSIVTDENIYAFDDFSYLNAHQLFIPTDYKTDQNDYGRNYIPPELWYKNNRRLNLPVCVPANSRCTIKDSLTAGYPLDTVEWHASRRVTNPDGINIRYVEEKLNTGH